MSGRLRLNTEHALELVNNRLFKMLELYRELPAAGGRIVLDTYEYSGDYSDESLLNHFDYLELLGILHLLLMDLELYRDGLYH